MKKILAGVVRERRPPTGQVEPGRKKNKSCTPVEARVPRLSKSVLRMVVWAHVWKKANTVVVATRFGRSCSRLGAGRVFWKSDNSIVPNGGDVVGGL